MVVEKFRKDPLLAATSLVLVLAVATIVGAFIFQALGYAPCELCLKERLPYYAGIAVTVLALVFVALGFRHSLPAALVVLALVFAGSMIFGAYHAGVEWGFWRGPSDCTGTFGKNESMTEFLQQLHTIKVVRCDAVAIRILGLSLAGWNAIISAALAAFAVFGLVGVRRR
jgi:disulfide bond formation protein DsbB